MNATARLKDFTKREVEGLTDELRVKLQAVRYLVGVPIHVTSGLRSQDTGSEHAFGAGVDISDNDQGDPIASTWRHRVLKAAFAVGFSRIGVYDRHIHLGTSTSHPQEVTWWGTSD